MSMDDKYIRRYQTFCKCFDNLQRSKYLDPDAANPIEWWDDPNLDW